MGGGTCGGGRTPRFGAGRVDLKDEGWVYLRTTVVGLVLVALNAKMGVGCYMTGSFTMKMPV
eukprot:764441-Hanusia_phi.AAC.2